jgi:hypothetical protein
MEKYIYDENNGLWYELQGDYYIPCLKLPDEEQVEIGIWGQRHLSYIQKHCKPFYNKMVSEHTLYDYLLQVNRDAEETFSELVKRMAEQEGITEHGFGRLTSNIGILVSKGRIPEYKDLFVRLMDIAAREIPVAKEKSKKSRPGNDFAVKELVCCVLECEKSGVFPQSKTDA